jgi:hypothetical protein
VVEGPESKSALDTMTLRGQGAALDTMTLRGRGQGAGVAGFEEEGPAGG